MLKKIAKRIEKELAQAEDYAEQAFLVRHMNSTTADLFSSLCAEEIEHAEKLLKEGSRLIEAANMSESTRFVLDEDAKESFAHDKCKTIWEWETRTAMTRVLELKYKLSQYRNMR